MMMMSRMVTLASSLSANVDDDVVILISAFFSSHEKVGVALPLFGFCGCCDFFQLLHSSVSMTPLGDDCL